jgi:hypothetical protein
VADYPRFERNQIHYQQPDGTWQGEEWEYKLPRPGVARRINRTAPVTCPKPVGWCPNHA